MKGICKNCNEKIVKTQFHKEWKHQKTIKTSRNNALDYYYKYCHQTNFVTDKLAEPIPQGYLEIEEKYELSKNIT